jgi:SAM-dependent methyltransferase
MRFLLTLPAVYSIFANFIGATSARTQLVEEHLHPCVGDKVLDIGCGPADILEFLPSVDYIGFDASSRYIAAAQKRFSTRGQFFCATVNQASLQEENFDLIIAFGILHHLDDAEALRLFDLSYTKLKPSGRLVTLDGCYTSKQSAIARYLVGCDRGRFVRDLEGYERLAKTKFMNINHTIRNNLLRIPYTHLILECTK